MGRWFDLVGQRFGRLTVVKHLYSEGKDSKNRNGRMWLCKGVFLLVTKKPPEEQLRSNGGERKDVIISVRCM